MFCIGFVVALYYHHSFLNTCYLLNGLRKRKESAFELNKSRVPERRHLGDRYIHIYIYTSIEARLRRASLLRRAGNSASVTVVQQQRFFICVIYKFIRSNGIPCNDGAKTSKGP